MTWLVSSRVTGPRPTSVTTLRINWVWQVAQPCESVDVAALQGLGRVRVVGGADPVTGLLQRGEEDRQEKRENEQAEAPGHDDSDPLPLPDQHRREATLRLDARAQTGGFHWRRAAGVGRLTGCGWLRFRPARSLGFLSGVWRGGWRLPAPLRLGAAAAAQVRRSGPRRQDLVDRCSGGFGPGLGGALDQRFGHSHGGGGGSEVAHDSGSSSGISTSWMVARPEVSER